MSTPMPKRGFTSEEFARRTERAQAIMAEHEFDALVLSNQANVRYFTGFDSQFWESPTRPWFIVVPRTRQSDRRHPGNRRAGDGGDMGRRHPHLAGAPAGG